MRAGDYLTLPEDFPYARYFNPEALPWEWIRAIRQALEELPPNAFPEGCSRFPPGLHVGAQVFVHESAKLPPYGVIEGPTYIGPGVELRPGVYIRGNVIVAGGGVLGNSCEFKNSLLLEGAQVPHFNYVGDSVLGQGAHLGAGSILSNLRFDQKNILIRAGGKVWETGMRKFGAVMGDHSEIGCNVVLNPGSLLGRGAAVAPGVATGGVIAEDTLVFARTEMREGRRLS